MNNILIIASTYNELAQSFGSIILKPGQVTMVFSNDRLKIDALVTGIGMVATAYHLTKHLCNQTYNMVLQAGVGGSFNRNINLGDLVNVVSDCFIELGTFTEKFETVFDLNLYNKNEAPFLEGFLHPSTPIGLLKTLPQVKAITVNQITGNSAQISYLEQIFNQLNYHPTIESMEGAAAFYVCSSLQTPIYQVRAISNYVEPRNRNNWQLDHAFASIHQFLERWIDQLKQCSFNDNKLH